MNNAQSLDALHSVMSDVAFLSELDSIIVAGTSSPDGDPAYNRLLAQRRANSIEDFIRENYPDANHSVYSVYTDQGYWDGLIGSVEQDPDVPARDEFLKMLRDPGLSDYAKNRRMGTMNNGEVIAYLRRNNILRWLRQGEVSMILRLSEQEPQPEFPQTAQPDPISESIQEPQSEPVPDSVPDPVPETPDAGPQRKTIIALRTNLLLDVLGGPNIGVEVPIGDHFSVAGDFAYGYARIKKCYALQTIQGSVEGRYWFKQRKNVLTGWNLGVYGTYCSRFDVRWGGGWQGDGYWSAGLTGGYSMPLSNSFNLDFSIAGGFFHSPEIRKYGKARNDHLKWEKTMYDVNRIALTQVRVDLVWLINKKVK